MERKTSVMKIRELYKGNKPYAYVAFNYADAKAADELLDSLDAGGYRYWLNAKITPSEKELTQIYRKIDMSAVTVLVLTENSIKDELIATILEHTVEKRSTLIVYMTEEPRTVREYLNEIHRRVTNCIVFRTWEQPFNTSNTVRQALSVTKGVTANYAADMYDSGMAVFTSDSPSVESMAEAFKKITYAAMNEYHPALNFLGEVALEKARTGQDSYSSAVAYFKSAVALGNSDSIYHIGCMIADGEGFAQNYQLAASYLSISAIQGITDAQYRFAEMLDNGMGVKIDREEAAKWYLKAIENGDRRAYLPLAYRYLKGDTVQKNESIAAEYFHEAAKDGDIDSLLRLAKLYKDGIGVQKDEEKSAYYFRKSAENGISEAQYEYAMILLGSNAKADKKDKNKAAERAEGFKWLHIAAQEREYGYIPSPEVYFELGKCYYYGIGTEHDGSKAFMYYYKAATAGHVKAREAVAECYKKGLGVTVNKRAAAFYEPKSADEAV